MSLATVTKVEEIISELLPAVGKHYLDAFTIQRYKREIAKNLGAYPWAGYIASEMLAVLEWDEEGVDAFHKKALSYRNDAETYSFYATSLQLIGRYAKATEAILVASKMSPENLSILRRAIDYAQSAGKYDLAAEIIKDFNLRSPKDPYIGEAFDMVLSALERSGMNQETIEQCHKVAFDVLRRHKVPFEGTRFRGDEQEAYVMFHITLDQPQDTINRLDEELGIALFDEVPDFDPSKYWIGYSKETEAK